MTYFNQKIFSYLFLLNLFLCPTGSYAQPIQNLMQEQKSRLLPIQFKTLFQCDTSFIYTVYLAGMDIGNLNRIIKWDKNSALATSTGNTKIFGLGSTYKQNTNLHWSPLNQRFYTDSFIQTVKGLDARKMIANISEDGTHSVVTLDDTKTVYDTDSEPLYDLDTFGEQLRLELLMGRTSINLYRQASDKIKHYRFEVVGKELIKTKTLGEIETIRVNEIGEYDGTVLWFSPVHDFQLIKAKIDSIISATVVLDEFNKQCE